jgi:hypothetical protein
MRAPARRSTHRDRAQAGRERRRRDRLPEAAPSRQRAARAASAIACAMTSSIPRRSKTYGVDQDDMLHFSGFGFDGLKSLSVVQHAARNSIGNALAASDFSGRQLGEGAMPKIALTYPAKLTEDRPSSAHSFVAAYSGPGSQKLPLVLTEGGRRAARLQADRHRAAREPPLRARRHVPGVRRAAGADRREREDEQLGHGHRADHARLREAHDEAASHAVGAGDEPQALPARRAVPRARL